MSIRNFSSDSMKNNKIQVVKGNELYIIYLFLSERKVPSTYRIIYLFDLFNFEQLIMKNKST